MTCYCCIINILVVFWRMSRFYYFFFFFAENFIFNGQPLRSSDFLWKLSFSSIFLWWMYDLVNRLAALIYKAQKSYFLGFMSKYPALNQEEFLLGEWMKVALTGHISSEYFQTYSSLSIDLMWIVGSTRAPAPRQWHIHTESKVITISESNGSETSFWVGKRICHLHS